MKKSKNHDRVALELVTHEEALRFLTLSARFSNWIHNWFLDVKVQSYLDRQHSFDLHEMAAHFKKATYPTEFRECGSRVRYGAFNEAHDWYYREMQKIDRRDGKHHVPHKMPEDRMLFTLSGEFGLKDDYVKIPGIPRMKWNQPVLRSNSFFDDIKAGKRRISSASVFIATPELVKDYASEKNPMEVGKWYALLFLPKETYRNDRYTRKNPETNLISFPDGPKDQETTIVNASVA